MKAVQVLSASALTRWTSSSLGVMPLSYPNLGRSSARALLTYMERREMSENLAIRTCTFRKSSHQSVKRITFDAAHQVQSSGFGLKLCLKGAGFLGTTLADE